MVADRFFQDEIQYIDASHQYFGPGKTEYTSVTKLVHSIEVPFDRDRISKQMAVSLATEKGISVDEAQSRILAEWDKKKDDSIEKGVNLHGALEDYTRTGVVGKGFEGPVSFLKSILKDYARFYPEVLLYSHNYRVAGRTDLVCIRSTSKDPVYDFYDYKTNQSKGICFDSAKRDNGMIVKHYNRYCLPPFQYLEACNYTLYALQLSIYAYLAMDRLKVKVGKLAIIFFDNSYTPHLIPVPFMYHEARTLCELNIVRKALPKTVGMRHEFLPPGKINSEYPLTPSEAFNPNSVNDDWE